MTDVSPSNGHYDAPSSSSANDSFCCEYSDVKPEALKKIPHSPAKSHKSKPKSKLEDPNAPKRARSAYLLFLCEQRPVITSQNPGLNSQGVTKILASTWNSLNDEQKRVYNETAQKEREEVRKAKEKYMQSDSYKNFKKLQAIHQAKAKGNAAKGKSKVNLKVQKGRNEQKSSQNGQYSNFPDECGISVFTPEFIEFNRKREGEWRNLRREVSAKSEEVAAQQKILGLLEANIDDLRVEINNDKMEVEQLEHYLVQMGEVIGEVLGAPSSGLSPDLALEKLRRASNGKKLSEKQKNQMKARLRNLNGS